MSLCACPPRSGAVQFVTDRVLVPRGLLRFHLL
jgi:hypothetical protein